MTLFIDKYRPKSFDKMDIHKDLLKKLINVSESPDFPHLLFHGQSGVGKKTLISCFIRSVFGAKTEKVRVDTKKLKVGANESKEVSICVVSSNSHVILNPSEAGYYDRFVITQMIKEIAQSGLISEGTDSSKSYKIIVIQEVDKLTKEAQQALRRTMEKYMKSCRIILSANSTCRIIAPILSRCLCIRVPCPSNDEMSVALRKISKLELMQSFTDQHLQSILQKADGNLRRAICLLEILKNDMELQQLQQSSGIKFPEAHWEILVQEIAKDIMSEQSPKKVLEVRNKFYNLISNCIPPEMILKRLAKELLTLDLDLQHKVCHWAAFYEHRMQCGTKPIFHLEAFVVRYMSIFKKIDFGLVDE